MDAALDQTLSRIRTALADRTPLRIRGGGSKDFHGLQLHGELLDTTPLQGIVSYEPSELVVTVRAGTPLATLEAALAEQGQYLAFEPPHTSSDGACTVGGMVAAGWSGPGRAAAGALRDFVLGIEMINGKAELLRFGGTVMKNVAGYDVSRLMAGSWGSLGLITEVSLKVLPIAPGEATLRIDGLTQTQALHQLHVWGGQPLPLNASSWHADAGLHSHTEAATGTLYVRLRGAVAAVHAACRQMGGERMDPALAHSHWQGCRNHTLPWFQSRTGDQALWRLSVPQTASLLPLPTDIAPALVEWHGAQRWVHAPRSMGPALKKLAAAAGGSASLFRAASAEKISAEAIFTPQNATIHKLHRQLQCAFDPSGIFNPGRTMAPS